MISCLFTPNSIKSEYLIRSVERYVPSPTIYDIPSINSTKAIRTIKPICQNSSNSDFINPTHSWMSSNQNAINKAQSFDEISNAETSLGNTKNVEKPQNAANQVSSIYIKNNQNKMFKLTFRAVNGNIIPLYTRERNFVEKDTDKKIQPYSKSRYVEEYTPHLIRFNTTRKAFEVNHLKEGRVSVMSMKQKIGKLMKKEIPLSKPFPGIGASKTNIQKSVLYIRVQNINFRFFPKVMTMDFTKPLNDIQSNNFSIDLGLETVDQRKNKGSIIASYKGDILKFTFSLIDINYQLVPVRISRSCQAVDDSIYIRRFSSVTDRIVQVPLPRNIYDYKDPMVDIRRRNEFFKHNKIEPKWLSDTRKNRLAANKQCQQVDPAQKAYEATNGSIILYEGHGTLNKAREGLVPCKISSEDLEKYERWVVNSQRDSSGVFAVEGEYLETYESNASYDVPDWDLIVYSK